MSWLEFRPTHKSGQNYFTILRQFDDLGVSHDGAVKSAFHALLDHCARQHDRTLVPEWEIRRPWRAQRSGAVCKAPAAAGPESASSAKDFQAFLGHQCAAAGSATSAALDHNRAVRAFQGHVPELAPRSINPKRSFEEPRPNRTEPQQ
jgi:hypothetical protein